MLTMHFKSYKIRDGRLNVILKMLFNKIKIKVEQVILKLKQKNLLKLVS